MTIFKTKKKINIDKAIGNMRITSSGYVGWDNDGNRKEWSEVHCWYDCDCENCPCGWESRGYEGECDDCGCMMSKSGDLDAPVWKCMLPRWIKNIVRKRKERKFCE